MAKPTADITAQVRFLRAVDRLIAAAEEARRERDRLTAAQSAPQEVRR